MNFVFINYVHPCSGSVSAKRLYSFAKESCAQDHKVIFICTGDHTAPDIYHEEVTKQRFEKWNGKEPFIISVPDTNVYFQKLHPVVNKIRIAYNYLIHRRLFPRWEEGSIAIRKFILENYQVDMVYATFGDTTTIKIAKHLAKDANASYVMDIKDPWNIFIPAIFQRWIARYFNDVSAITANSDFTWGNSKKSFRNKAAHIIYSGVDAPIKFNSDFVLKNAGSKYIFLSGSIYDKVLLTELVQVLTNWETQYPGRNELITFVYAGVNASIVEEYRVELEKKYRVQIFDQLSEELYYSLCAYSSLNMYIKSPRTFHHKLIDLLVFNKPLMAYPSEDAEGLKIVEGESGNLISTEELRAFLNTLSLSESQLRIESLYSNYSWRVQTTQLLNVLLKFKSKR